MAIASFTSDYTGRLKDVSIFKGQNFKSSAVQPVGVAFGNPSQFCSGTQKLVQKYAILLLTGVGSQQPFPDFGTSFLPEALGVNNNMSIVEFRHTFNFANLDVLGVLRSYQAANPDIPLDEQINTATLEDFVSSGDSVSCTINISTNAGDDIVFVLPIPYGN